MSGDPSFKEIADQTLGMAELIGFFIPGEGYVLSLGAAGLRSALDLFWPGGADEVNPMAKMGEAIVESMIYLQRQNERFTWSMFEAEHLANLRKRSDELAFVYNAVLRGVAHEGVPDREIQRNWDIVLANVEQECLGDSEVVQTIDWIVQPANNDFRHLLTPVYTLAAAVRLNYLQLGLLIQSEHMVRNYEAAYREWKAERGSEEGEEAAAPKRPRGDSDEVKGSPYFLKLAGESERYATEGRARVEQMATEFEELHEAKRQRARQFVIKPGSAGYSVEDKGDPEASPSEPLPQRAAELLIETRRARAVLEVEESLLSRKGGLREMSEDGLGKLRKSVAVFEKTSGSFPQQTRL